MPSSQNQEDPDSSRRDDERPILLRHDLEGVESFREIQGHGPVRVHDGDGVAAHEEIEVATNSPIQMSKVQHTFKSARFV